MAEINDDATPEQIGEFVDQLVKEDNETPVDETKPVDETLGETESTEKSEDTGEEWLDDDFKAEIAAYGMDEEEFSDFTSREEAERALRLFDKSAAEVGRKAVKPPEEEVEKKEEDEKKPSFEVTLDKDDYDEGLVEQLTQMRDHYEDRVQALEGRFAEADARAEEERFDHLVDSLGHADLLGTTGKENSKQLERRQDLILAVKAQQIGLEQLGRPVDLDTSLVNRVARMVFADELTKKELKARTRSLSKQSDARQGGGTTRPNDAPESGAEYAERLYKEMSGA